MLGKIYKSTGSWYTVKTPGGQIWSCRLKGLFKLDNITSTNPIAVGDNVDFEPESADESADAPGRTGIITVIHDRRNHINRQSPSHKLQQHIVAANIDQSLLVVTLKEPRTSQGFIDRWLVTCEAYHVAAILLFNKADLYRAKEEEKFAAWQEMYTTVGYPLIRMSTKTGEGLEAVRDALRGKISLLSGHSGVGKSSFLNALFPGMNLKTHEVSGWSGKGTHTTTFAEMFDLPARGEIIDPGQIIDTPGMREFGLIDISRPELAGYFKEMKEYAGKCQFNNCLHTEEPGCEVKRAVEEGRIDPDRYISYVNILTSIETQSW